MIRILIVDDSVTVQAALFEALRGQEDLEVVGTANNGEQALEVLEKLQPNIVLMDIMMPGMGGIEATRQMARTFPSASVIIISSRDELKLLQQAMQAGASEYLNKPFDTQEVLGAIRRVYALDQRRAAYKQSQESAAAAPAGTDGKAAEQKLADVIGVFSAKGGVGRSLISLNLATAIAKATTEPVALVDLDLLFGDIASLLGLDVSRTISELITQDDYEKNVVSMMHRGPENVSVLLAPSRPELAETIDVDAFKTILQSLRERFDFVVLDMPTNFSEINLAALDECTQFVMVSTPGIPAIFDTKLMFTTLEHLGYPAERVHLIINHAEGDAALGRQEIEKTIKRSVALEIPWDSETVQHSIAQAAPFVELTPQEAISRAIRDLVGILVPAERISEPVAEPAGGRKRGRFGKAH